MAFRLLALVLLVAGCATTAASPLPAKEATWLVTASQRPVCTAVHQATLEAGYRLEGSGPTVDGGCALYVEFPMSAAGYGHRSAVVVREDAHGRSRVQWTTRRRFAPNLTDPIETMQRKVMTRVRSLVERPGAA